MLTKYKNKFKTRDDRFGGALVYSPFIGLNARFCCCINTNIIVLSEQRTECTRKYRLDMKKYYAWTAIKSVHRTRYYDLRLSE